MINATEKRKFSKPLLKVKPTIKARVRSFDMYERAPGDGQVGKNI